MRSENSQIFLFVITVFLVQVSDAYNVMGRITVLYSSSILWLKLCSSPHPPHPSIHPNFGRHLIVILSRLHSWPFIHSLTCPAYLNLQTLVAVIMLVNCKNYTAPPPPPYSLFPIAFHRWVIYPFSFFVSLISRILELVINIFSFFSIVYLSLPVRDVMFHVIICLVRL